MQTDDEALRRSDPVALELPSHSQAAGSSTDEVGRLIYTPAAAAERLTVGESWLRSDAQPSPEHSANTSRGQQRAKRRNS